MSTSNKDQQIAELEQLVKETEARLNQAKNMLSQVAGSSQPYATLSSQPERLVLGTFSGEYMIGEDKKQYPVPANYASKSKLVEGDQLKLNITPDGAFIYKQIGPIPRRRAIAKIVFQDNSYYAKVGAELYRLLTASVTYFRLSPDDEVTILTPLTKKSEWAAIENVVSSLGGMQDAGAPTPSTQGFVPVEEPEDDDEDGLKIQPW